MATWRTPQKQIELAYKPREQFIPFHQRSLRFSCIVAHRRAGKTVACVNELVIRALYTSKKRAQYGYVAPFRQQAKAIAWVYLKEAVEGIATEVRESDLSVTLPNGAKISLYGSDNPNALRGLYFDGLIIDEFADCRPSLWVEVLLPTLADRKGWCVFIGTPKGRNQFYDFYEISKKDDKWFSLTLRADTSGIIDAEEMATMKAQMSEAQYEQEMLCSFTAALLGTYYAQLIARMENEKRISDEVTWDREFPVTVAADLGRKDSTVLWFFQERPDGVAIIDCEEASNENLEYYFNLLDHKPYEYDKIWLPHDAVAKTLATKKSTIEQFIDHYGKDKLDIVPRLSRQHGIDAVRMVLPYCWFNETRCRMGVEALRTYRKSFNEVLQVYNDDPLHSWESDYADGMRYLALVANKRRLKPPEAIAHTAVSPYPGYNLASLFAERERGPRNSTHSRRI